MSIQFKSSSKTHHELSNFYGGAEFNYMAQRTENPALSLLYSMLRDMEMDDTLFRHYHGRLDPTKRRLYKKDPTRKGIYLKHYIEGKSDSIAKGILAKLISGCWRETMKARLKVVNEIAQELLGNHYQVIYHKDFIDGTDEQKIEWMWNALKMKYHQPYYKNLLLSTGDMVLMEQGRGDWAGENGWLGQLLMILRNDIRICDIKF